MNEKKCLTAGSVGGAAWLIAGVLLLAPTLPAVAAESVLPITPPGSTDTDQALLPPKPRLLHGAVLAAVQRRHPNLRLERQGRAGPVQCA